MAIIREVFDQYDLDLIFEALEHRRRYYANKIPQQRANAATGTIKAACTLEKYYQRVEDFEKILAKWVDETT